MEGVITSLTQLKVAVEDEKENIPKALEDLVNKIHQEEDSTELCEGLMSDGVLPLASSAIQSDSPESQSKGAELIAELAKVESCRQGCVSGGVVPHLVTCMGSESTAVALQACRALGNICYEHVYLADGGRVCVLESGGPSKLLALLQRAGSCGDGPDERQLRLVATGFLLNLLNSYDSVQNQSMDAALVDVLCQYLESYAEDEDIPTHVLLSLSCMADTENGRSLVVARDISPQLVKVLNVNESAEVTETCLELISNLAEPESVKTQLAAGGVCEAVVSVIRRHRDHPSAELSPPIVKTATDLIVLILVGDKSMGIIYGGGSGSVYQELVSWLGSENDDLQIAGALAMGNFARSDAHCIQMVQGGIAEKLLTLLSSHNTGDGDIRLQHALLAALRNLSIAKENKGTLISQGVLDVLLPMAKQVETFPVVFKLLATLRMVIDGQSEAAIKVGSCTELIDKLVLWCGINDHPGVQGEASRLVAWVIKNCQGNKEVLEGLVNAGCLGPLVFMLGSEHPVMVNEAALALTLVASSILTEKTVTHLTSGPLTDRLGSVAGNPHPPEILANILSLMVTLTTNETTCKYISTDEIRTVIKKLNSHTNEQVKELAGTLEEKLKAN
ncbi:visceral mesodermal armadillo-repeats isoform X2 [Oratosquilla oratoria]|uniref:visceral mesodermal armadillo-repeats isoform X2 n=1 Tax=Oratosquilla oratoria TaxID=337810 RepID=UPI003F75868C